MMSSAQDAKRRALGRGLEALLPSRAESRQNSPSPQSEGRPLELPVEAIERNPFQTRSSFDAAKIAELARSIAASGVIQPITVRVLNSGGYQLVTGERRLIASKEAGRKTIPAIVRAVSDAQAMEMTIVENLQRTDLNPMEQARAFQRLAQEFNLTQEQMATRTGKERASVANFIRLLRLPAEVQKSVEAGELSFGHARALLSLPSAEQITAAAGKTIALALSVRQTETYVNGLIDPEKKREKSRKVIEPKDPNVYEAQERLQRALGLRVRIEDKKGRGRVIIDYANLEDFDLLLGMLDSRLQER